MPTTRAAFTIEMCLTNRAFSPQALLLIFRLKTRLDASIIVYYQPVAII